MKAVRSDARPGRASRSYRAAAVALSLGVLGSVLVTTVSSGSAAGVVSGTVYRDLNNNGVRENAEPGVVGLVVSSGTTSTVTDVNGAWSMSLTGSAEVRLATGWYRTQCNDVSCDAGPGAQQDFEVKSQRIVADVSADENPVLDVGIIPDWPGGYPIPAARPIPLNSLDVSARVSFVAPTGEAGSPCFRTDTAANRACAIGDQPTFLAQVYNEGLTPISEPTGYLELPVGTSFVGMVPSVSPANNPAVPSVSVGAFSPADRRVPFIMHGTLPAGGAAMFTVTLLVTQGAPLTTTFQTNGAYPNAIGIRVTNVTGDAEGDACAPTAACNYGQTNKQVEPDNSDTVGFAIVAGQAQPPATTVPPVTTPPATTAPATTAPPVTTAAPATTVPPVTTVPRTTVPATTAPAVTTTTAAPATTGPPATAAATGCRVSSLLVPSCGAWLGASAPAKNGGSAATGLAEYEAVAKMAPDILHFYKSGNSSFPTAAEKALASRSGKQRSILHYNWRGTGTWRQIANGSADAQIATVAKGIKAYNYKIFLAISHEPENEFKTSASSGMTPADYVAMFRHVVTELRSLGVTNAVFVWNVMGFDGWASVIDSFYPGHDVVDWIAYDPYGHVAQDTYDKFVNRPNANRNWSGFYAWATKKAPGKPIMMAEWGIILGEQPKAVSIVDGAASTLQAKYPMLKALVYWNQAGPFAVRLDQKTTLGIAYGQAYARMAANSYFNATSTALAP
jgi:hypothetical protein